MTPSRRYRKIEIPVLLVIRKLIEIGEKIKTFSRLGTLSVNFTDCREKNKLWHTRCLKFYFLI